MVDLTYTDCNNSFWIWTANGLFRTIQDNSVSPYFERNGWNPGSCYKYPLLCVGEVSWHFAKILWYSQANLPLCLTYFGQRFLLWVREHLSAFHQVFELCDTRKSSSKHHWLVSLRFCCLTDGLENMTSLGHSRRLWRRPGYSCERFSSSPWRSGKEQL